mgnify:CR=1 FL=1
MNILALETSTAACSIALQVSKELLVFHEVAPMQHTQLILPKIHEMLKEGNLNLVDLDAICFSEGPGSFTGLRIAASVTQGLSFPHQIPVISLSSMAVWAQTAFIDRGWANTLVCVDAKMEAVYLGIYQINDGLAQPVMNDTFFKPKQTFEAAGIPTLANQKWYAVGDGWVNYGTNLVKSLNLEPQKIDNALLPKASAMLFLATEKLRRSEHCTAFEAMPNYLR